MEVLDAMNWARGVVGVGASFCGRGLFRDGPKGANCASSEILKKATKKKANY